MKLWQTILLYIGIVALLFVYKNDITHWMTVSSPSLPLLFLVTLCFVLFPVLPFKIIIGTLGYMYGPLTGAIISWLAASVGSIIAYLLVRTYFHEKGRTYLAKYRRLEQLQTMIERSPFLAILLARLVPVFPQAIVNIYPAFLRIRLATYITASALGKIPAMLVYAFLGESIFTDLPQALKVIGIYVLFLLLTYSVYRLWLKDKWV